VHALRNWVRDLAEKYDDDNGLEFFNRGDMSLYGSGTDPETVWSRRGQVKKPAKKKLPMR
jgi:hypothetical protein